MGHERSVVVGAPVPPRHSRMQSKQNGWSQWPEKQTISKSKVTDFFFFFSFLGNILSKPKRRPLSTVLS